MTSLALLRKKFATTLSAPGNASVSGWRLLSGCFALWLILSASTALAEKATMTGKWVLSRDLTAAAQPRNKEKKGIGNIRVRPVISVGGYGFPIPGLPGGKKSSSPVKGSAKNPDVLSADEMEITEIDGNVILDFTNIGITEFKPGKDHGTRTTWTGKKLYSKYKSTSRSVSQEYLMKGDHLLIVTVRIKPTGASKKVYKKVFQRPQ